MRITNIDELKQVVNVVDVVGRFVELKQKGSRWSGLCPFHNEKTPSFTVTPSIGIFKCFGCGKTGDSISFVMQHEHKDFVSAVETVADIAKFKLDYSKKDEFSKEQLSELEELRAINTKACGVYRINLLALKDAEGDNAWKYALSRLNEESIIQWQIGYAPDEWKFLTNPLIESGKFKQAEQLGLVKTRNDNNYDVFRNRLMFPIQDTNGFIIGFGGRDLSGSEKAAKYLNSTDSKLYNKSSVLYGLHIAGKSIRDKKHAILTEGYMDVISMHESGATNTIGSCGTSLTEGQCTLLKKYTSHVIIMRDGDDAGKKATLRDIDLFLKYGFKVELVELKNGQDPDQLAASMRDEGKISDFIRNNKTDAITWKADLLFSKAGDDIHEKSEAMALVVDMLSVITDDVKREEYIKILSKRHGIKPKTFESQLKKAEESKREKVQHLDEDEFALPGWVSDKEEFFKNGFVPRFDGDYTGYYFGTGTSKLTRMTNFVIKPLLHIYHKQDNKRMIEVTNGRTTKIIEMPSKSLISVEQFEASLFEEGFFYTEGGFNKVNLKKLISVWGEESFPICYELKSLGWQPEGFFAYSNFVYDGDLKRFDDMGIVAVNTKRYYSPSVSSIQADVRTEDDIYENDRYLSYSEPPVNFEQWSRLFIQVYGQNGWMGIAYVMVTLFRDIVFASTKVPHLYAYGAVQAGKSEFGESISNAFFNNMPAFNLNQGTDFAFFSRMERFRNCPNALNEFDENAIKDEWFRAIKGAYDGEGREKGRGGKEGKTRTQKITCTLVLMGQYLSTKDDNSVLSRCIPLAFRENNNRTEEQISNFRNLKELEKNGLSGMLIELMGKRSSVKRDYAQSFAAMQRRVTDDLLQSGKVVKSRILKNVCAPMAMVEIMAKHIQLPFTSEEFYSYGKGMIEQVSNLVSESNSLAEFWRTVEFLLERTEITEGIEFRLEDVRSVRVSVGRETQEKTFEEITKVLFIRLNIIHPLYAENFKRKYNKPAPNLETIRLYLGEQGYFVGNNPGSFFKTKDGKRTNTSSIVLDYEKLGVNLERFSHEEADTRTEVEVSGLIMRDAVKNGSVIQFDLTTIKTEGYPQKTTTLYYRVFLHGVEDHTQFTDRRQVKVKGMLLEKEGMGKNGKYTSRTIDALEYEFADTISTDPDFMKDDDTILKF